MRLLQAGSIVQQNLAQIRTVTAYNGQQRASDEYDSKLDGPTQVSGTVPSWSHRACVRVSGWGFRVYRRASCCSDGCHTGL